MKVLVFGAGGVGSVVGGFLARTGHDVTLLGRPWHLEAIQKSGLRIAGIWGEYRIKAFELFTDIESLKRSGKNFDLIILSVKSFDTEEALGQMAPIMNPKTTVLSLQNGLGNIEAILKKVSADQLLVGRVIFGVETEPGVATVTVSADDVVIGPAPGSRPKNLTAEQAANYFATAKIPTRPVTDILPFIWAKVIYNCALNGICTLHKISYGKILDESGTREWMIEVIRECYAVGLAKKVNLVPKTAEEFIDLMLSKLIPSTAAHHPSMLQDLKRGKRIEIDRLNGAIAREGRLLGIQTPGNERVVQRLKEIVKDQAKVL